MLQKKLVILCHKEINLHLTVFSWQKPEGVTKTSRTCLRRKSTRIITYWNWLSVNFFWFITQTEFILEIVSLWQFLTNFFKLNSFWCDKNIIWLKQSLQLFKLLFLSVILFLTTFISFISSDFQITQNSQLLLH